MTMVVCSCISFGASSFLHRSGDAWSHTRHGPRAPGNSPSRLRPPWPPAPSDRPRPFACRTPARMATVSTTRPPPPPTPCLAARNACPFSLPAAHQAHRSHGSTGTITRRKSAFLGGHLPTHGMVHEYVFCQTIFAQIPTRRSRISRKHHEYSTQNNEPASVCVYDWQNKYASTL